jgi:hypothetical protein
MKISRSFSLDEELLPKLGVLEKPSELVNQLLTGYFAGFNNERTLEQRLKEVDLLQDAVVKQKETARAKIEADIKIGQESLKKINEEAEKQLNENITLLESSSEITKDLVDYFLERKSKGLPTDFKPDNQEAYNKILDIIEKYRIVGLRVGVVRIRDYLKFKGIFV